MEVPDQGLTFRSTRTPPALPAVLSQLLVSSAPLVASAQAGPDGIIRQASNTSEVIREQTRAD